MCLTYALANFSVCALGFSQSEMKRKGIDLLKLDSGTADNNVSRRQYVCVTR